MNELRAHPWRGFGTRLCLVLAGVALFLAAILGVSGRNIFRAESFGARAADSLGDPRVAEFVADRLTDQIIAETPQLLGARPFVRGIVQGLLNTTPFRALVRRAALYAHEAAFSESGRNVVLSIPDFDVVLRGALEQASPALAAKIPPRLGATLASLSADNRLELLVKLWRIGLAQRWAALVLLFVVAPLLVLGALGASLDRRRTLVHIGITLAVAGFAIAAVVPAGRLLAFLWFHDPLTRGAFVGVWLTYLGALRQWGLFFAVLGILFAAGGSTMLERFDLSRFGRYVSRRVTTVPPARRGRIAWAMTWILVGLIFAFFPIAVLSGCLVILGAGAAFVGIRELFLVLHDYFPTIPAVARMSPERGQRLSSAIVVGLILLVGAVWAVKRNPDSGPAAAFIDACNGHPELCDRRVDQVVFAASHNSMSNSQISDWMFPHHQANIARQLEDGIRVLLIDVHRGFPGAARIKTDLQGEEITHERLEETLGPEGVLAAERIRDRLVGVDEAHPHLYLCHGFCELGAYELEPTLEVVRNFMVEHPQEVLIVVLEDYVTTDEIVSAFAASGLDPLVYKGASKPWPTLRELITLDQRIIVFIESGHPGVDWLRPTIGNIQETPYFFAAPADFSCKPNRGGTDGALYQINHWIQTTPAPKLVNAELVNARPVLMTRAQQFVRERGHIPNIIAVDFYGTGALFAVVDSLNGVASPIPPVHAGVP